MARRGQEPLGQLTPLHRVDVVARPAFVHVPACPAGELADRGVAAVEGGGDLGEGEPEGLPQDEDRPFQRGEGFEHDQDRHRHTVREDGALLGVRRLLPEVGGQRLRKPRPHVRLTPGLDLAEPVQGEPGGDADQVRARFADLGTVAAGPAQPGVLHHVLRVGQAAEHAVGHPGQYGTVLLEDIGGGARGGHRAIPADPPLLVHKSPARSRCG